MLDVHALARGRAAVHALAVVAGRRRRPHVEGRLAVAAAVGDVVDAHERELERLERGAARLRNFRQIGGHSPSGQDSTTYAKPKRAAATWRPTRNLSSSARVRPAASSSRA